MARKEVYCENCDSYQPMVEHEPRTDELNASPWYDVTCGTCCSIIASVRIVPDVTPMEPSRAIEFDEPRRRHRTRGLGAFHRANASDEPVFCIHVYKIRRASGGRGELRHAHCVYVIASLSCPPHVKPHDFATILIKANPVFYDGN